MRKAIQFIFSKKEKVYLLYIAMLIIAGSIFELAGVAIFSPFIEIMTVGEIEDNNSLIGWLYVFFRAGNIYDFISDMACVIIIIYVVKNLFLTYEKNTLYKFSYSTQQRIATRLMESYLKKPYAFHLKTNPAELLRTIQIDADNFAKTIIHALELVMELIVCFFLVVFLFITSPIITAIIALLLFGVVFFYVRLTKGKLRQAGEKIQIYGADIFKYMNQAFGGIKEIKVLGREDYFINCFSDSFSKNVRLMRIGRLASILPKYFVETVCILGLMLAIIIEVKLNPGNVADFIPQIAVFATAAFRLMPSVGRINEHVAAMNTNNSSVMQIYHDLIAADAKSEIDENSACGGRMELNREIEVVRLYFCYPDAEKNVLNGVDLKIKKGKTVAFVGESGAGKTTLVDIILGILKPQSGNVLVDGKDIEDDIKRWQRNIGYIPQTIYLSDASIMENIAFGVDKSNIDINAVRNAARQAQLVDFVNTLPEGYYTVVGERGARLSGGQRQRIGIARALYHNPEVLVLDEATSALDNDTEKAVMQAIDGLHGEKTIIIIAHRLSTIQNADVVYEVIDGKAIERSKSIILGDNE